MENREEYEEIQGKKRAIIWRRAGEMETDECPFCGKIHTHGVGLGHRVVHCVRTRYAPRTMKEIPLKGFYASDGSWLDHNDGYILKEYGDPSLSLRVDEKGRWWRGSERF